MTRPLALAAALLAAAAVAGCQGNRGEPETTAGSTQGRAPGDDAPAPSAPPAPGDAGEPAGQPDDARLDDPEPADPSKLIADLGAIPAWQAVVDRAQLLVRRGQHGVVFGRLGPPILVPGPPPEPNDAGVRPDAGLVASPYAWLIDDTEGNGALAIRVDLGGRPGKDGDRVALGGAWALDGERRWYWKVDVVQPLAPAAPSDLKDPPAAAPGHAIANGELPAGARTITVARDHDAIYFQLVGAPPANDGDGWPVANELGDPVFALLTLPGERASYGGQDMRSPDERWQLKRGQTYWVRIGKIRKRGPDKPVAMQARTAPVRVN